MITLLIVFIFAAAFIAITSFVYSYVLVQPGEVFAWLFLKLDRFFKTDERQSDGKGVHPIFKMIMWCEKCVAGQMALWFFFAWARNEYFNCRFLIVIPHILFIGLSIFLTLYVKKFYKNHIE